MYNEISIDQLKQVHALTVYQAPVQKLSVTTRGTSLLLAGIFGLVFTFSPILIEEIKYRFSSPSENTVADVSSGEPLGEESKRILNPVDRNFSLLIPKIRLNAPVIANINPYDEKEYKEALTGGLAHAKGTSFPGEGKAVYIFGHSSNYLWDKSKYRAAFYLLKNLEISDKIVVAYDNQLFVYQVSEKKVVEPNELSFLSEGTKEKLILQTCWPPISNWKRLVLIAQPLEVSREQPVVGKDNIL